MFSTFSQKLVLNNSIDPEQLNCLLWNACCPKIDWQEDITLCHLQLPQLLFFSKFANLILDSWAQKHFVYTLPNCLGLTITYTFNMKKAAPLFMSIVQNLQSRFSERCIWKNWKGLTPLKLINQILGSKSESFKLLENLSLYFLHNILLILHLYYL